MMRLRFRRSQSSSLSKQKKGDATSYLGTIEDKEILRVVQDIRRRNGLPDVSSKSAESSSSLTAQFTSSSGTTDSSDNRALKSKQSFGKGKFIHRGEDKEASKPEQPREEVDSDGSNSFLNKDEHGERISPSSKSPRDETQSLRMIIKNRVPLSIDTLLDFSEDSDDSGSQDGGITNCETHSSGAISPRTPRSAQLFSLVCSPVFGCNDKIEKLATTGIGPTNASSESEASNDDESKSWMTESTTREFVHRPSFFKSVYDQVAVIGENDTMVAATVFDNEIDTLYPTSFIEPPPPPRALKVRKQSKKKHTKDKLKYFEESNSILDDESYVGDDTTFLSLSESILTDATSRFAPYEKETANVSVSSSKSTRRRKK